MQLDGNMVMGAPVAYNMFVTVAIPKNRSSQGMASKLKTLLGIVNKAVLSLAK